MPQLELIFGNLIFPIIKHTKKDEENIAKNNGWMDIMLLSWFCQSPIKGQPCGICNPCDDAMHTGMEWRLPKEAQIRHKFRFILYPMRRIWRRIFK